MTNEDGLRIWKTMQKGALLRWKVQAPLKSNSLLLIATVHCYQTCFAKSDNYSRTKKLDFSMNSP